MRCASLFLIDICSKEIRCSSLWCKTGLCSPMLLIWHSFLPNTHLPRKPAWSFSRGAGTAWFGWTQEGLRRGISSSTPVGEGKCHVFQERDWGREHRTDRFKERAIIEWGVGRILRGHSGGREHFQGSCVANTYVKQSFLLWYKGTMALDSIPALFSCTLLRFQDGCDPVVATFLPGKAGSGKARAVSYLPLFYWVGEIWWRMDVSPKRKKVQRSKQQLSSNN